MNIEFATNDPATARRYLGAGDTAYLSDEAKDAIVELVRMGAGDIRVRDPKMYNNSPDLSCARALTDAEAAQVARITELRDRDLEASKVSA